MKKSLKIALLFLTTLTFIACGRICIGKMLSIAKKSMVFRKFACLYATSHRLALLFLTLILVACGSSGGGGSAGGNTGGGGNPDETPSTKIRISEATGDEGGMITFKVIANPTNAKQITFRYEATVDNKATNPASISDLSSELTGNGTIATNDSSVTISILTANDNLREHNETFMVILSDLSPNEVTFTDHTAIGTILANDDATGIVTISVADAKASEASSEIIFKVTSAFPAATGSPFTFGYEVDLDNSSADTDDFEATSGTARILADSTSTTISISLRQDTTVEPDETFSLRLTNPTSPNATIDSANSSAVGTILNDDLGEISNATAMLGDTAITLSWTNTNSNIFAGVRIAQTTGSTAPAENCSSGTTTDIGKVTSHNIASLVTGSTHSFRICARSNDGSLSGGFPLPNLIPQPTVDNNGNGLIELATATELNNIRHNLAGTGYKTSSTAAGFTRGCPNNMCSGYELTANIDLSSFNSGTWNPIGSNGNRFTAIFDGNNNRISGLDISSDSDYIGLFSAIQDAAIRNLKLTNISITGNSNVGALVGDATNSTLSNIELIGDNSQSSSDAEIKGNGSNVGGLVGDFNGTISDASSSLTVRGGGNRFTSNTGGLVGWLQSGSIKNSNSSGSVSTLNSISNTGGLVGQSGLTAPAVNNTTISNSWASGNLSNRNFSNVGRGGLVGYNTGTIRNSWASGHISINENGNFSSGGLVGWNYGHIYNSWASGNVTGNNNLNRNYGGLVGNNHGTISNNWASGEVTGNISLGGLVGNNQGNINRRNYRLDSRRGARVNENNSIRLGDGVGNSATGLRDLASLSGAASTDTSNASKETHSNWHAGFNAVNTQANLFTRFCDTNGNGNIDGTPDGQGERTPNNSVWVMAPDANNVTTNTNEANQPASYYQIPAIRCIGNTKGKTPTEINAIRKANIDRQRHKFPQP